MTTILYHPLFRQHNRTYNHPDNPARIDAILEGIKPYRTQLPLQPATFEEITRVHSPYYVSKVLEQRGKRGSAGPGSPLTEHSVDAALWSAGAAIEAATLASLGETALALCRPAGHHACATTGMGFCVFNNIAIAAAHCMFKGLERIYILDFDVHHGNGTQEIFYKDPGVFFCSIHQKTAYPQSGGGDETGEGLGGGYNLNIPVSDGSGDAEYLRCMDEVVVPSILRYRPQVILVSAGFDAHTNDPLSKTTLSTETYGGMVGSVWKTAHTLGVGLALILEGGYSIHNLGDCVSSCLDQLPEPILYHDSGPSY